MDRAASEIDVDRLHRQAVMERAKRVSNRKLIINFTLVGINFKIVMCVQNGAVDADMLRTILINAVQERQHELHTWKDYAICADDLFTQITMKYPNRPVVVEIQSGDLGCLVEYGSTLLT